MSEPIRNVEAEVRVLGGIIVNNANLATALRGLRVDDFSRPSHRLIFSAMRNLAVDEQPIDYVTLREELRRTGNLEKAPEYFALGDDVSGADVGPYVKMVADCAARRSAIHRLDAGLERLRTDHGDTNAILADIRSLVDEHFDLVRQDGPVADDMADVIANLGEDPTPIVDGLFVPGTCGFIGADAGGGKTTTADSLALSVCMGYLVWGRYAVPGRRPVLLIQLEDPKRRHGKRLARLARGMGLDEVPRGWLYRWSSQRFFLDDPRDVQKMLTFIQDKNVGGVIADPFVYLHGKEEKDNMEMIKMLKPIKDMFMPLNCFFAIIHHHKHADPGYKGAVEVGRIRGASALGGWRDFLLTLTPRGPQVAAKFYSKDVEPGTQRFLLQRSTWNVGDDLPAERIEYREAEDGPMVRPDSNPDRLLRAIESLEADEDGWVHVAVAAERAGIRHRATINRTVKSLARAGHIESQPGSGRTPARVRLLGAGKAEQGEMRYADAEEEQF